MVDPLIKLGNILNLVAKASPIGLIQITMCIFLLTLAKYIENMFILLGWRFFFTQSALQLLIMLYISFQLYRFATSPLFKILLMSQSICSFMIWVSTNKKLKGLFWTPAFRRISLMSYLQFFMLQFFITYICLSVQPIMNVASFDNDCLPLPPTPKSKALP